MEDQLRQPPQAQLSFPPLQPPAHQPAQDAAPQQPPVVPTVTVVGSHRIERFDTEEPIPWFIQFEATMRINRIHPDDHYDHLLAALHREARAPIVFQMQSPPEDPDSRYKWLKHILIEGHHSP